MTEICFTTKEGQEKIIDLDITRGDDVPITLTLEDPTTGLPLDLTNDTFTVSVKKQISDKAYTFQVVAVSAAPLTGVVVIKIDKDKTLSLPLGEYVYDIKRDTLTESYTLMKGKLFISFNVNNG
jgi:hypothetical protein